MSTRKRWSWSHSRRFVHGHDFVSTTCPHGYPHPKFCRLTQCFVVVVVVVLFCYVFMFSNHKNNTSLPDWPCQGEWNSRAHDDRRLPLVHRSLDSCGKTEHGPSNKYGHTWQSQQRKSSSSNNNSNNNNNQKNKNIIVVIIIAIIIIIINNNNNSHMFGLWLEICISTVPSFSRAPDGRPRFDGEGLGAHHHGWLNCRDVARMWGMSAKP